MGEELSRRKFIKGSVLFGAAAATTAAMATTVGATLTSCAPRGANDNSGGTNGNDRVATMQFASGDLSYVVHEADIIVVGGGMSGLNATRVANDNGASVILVDKGPVGHSGNSGVLWGQSFVSAENNKDDGVSIANFFAIDCMGIMNQEQARNVGRAHVESRPRIVIEQSGNLFQRDDDNKVVGNDVEGMAATHNALYKQSAQMLTKRGIPIYSNMMMLDILLDDKGNSAGIVAISLADGSAHVFRGKKTILCTGGYHWATGKTGGSPESTGEGHYALLKRGYAFKDMEFPQYDFCGIHPFGYRPDKEQDQIELAVTFPVNGEIHKRMLNKDGVSYTLGFFDDPSKQDLSAFQGALIATAKEFYQNKATSGDGSNNGIYFNLKGLQDEPNSQSYPSYKGLMRFSTKNLNYNYPDNLECLVNEYSSAGVPAQNPQTCEHEIPGLYPIFVALSAGSSTWNWGQSYLAAKDASAKVAEEASLPAFSPDDVQSALLHAYDYLQRDVKDGEGIRSTEVHRRIQRAFYKGQDFMKSEDGMKTMLAELERIQKEDLPKMVCKDKSLNFNRDWKMAMEIDSMLYCSLATVHAAMARKESRSPFFRSDYPKMDNTNFLCYLWVSVNKNGVWNVEKGDVVDTVLPRSEIMRLLDDSDPKYDISVPNKSV
ncbi:MAG: FAD-binding protein [Coriobacteriales bacterium]|jgi:succinate dehydrogenase/fumarate reductase flavoprotein subunit|nr:FAD-binding protein [Coriobacteriales bacterium]